MPTQLARTRRTAFQTPAVLAIAFLFGTGLAVPSSRGDTLAPADGQAATGSLASDPALGIVFRPQGGDPPTPLQPGMTVTFDGEKVSPTDTIPPFRLDLGYGQRLSGRLGSFGEAGVQLDEGPGGKKVVVARPGVLSIVQRPG